MVDLPKVVDDVKEKLKDMYLQNQSAVWHHPFVGFMTQDDVKFMSGAKDEETIVSWFKEFRGSEQIKGIVVGRMVAKYSKTLRDLEGNPQVLEKAILVSGRVLDSKQTYIVIVPCREHQDLRMPEHGEPLKDKPFIPGINSPDKVAPIIDDLGVIRGFKEMQFGKEQIFDSRRGDQCVLDPIIDGVISHTQAGGK